MVKIKREEITLLSAFVHRVSGIRIDASKAYLLETRLGHLLKEEGCRSFGELYRKIKGDKQKRLEKQVINAITTKETLFFRDSSPFELLKHKIMPDLIDSRSTKYPAARSPIVRIWSSACSTGQEIYSIAIVIRELLGRKRSHRIRLMGTDLSDTAIAQASAGTYTTFEIERGLPREKRHRYFVQSGKSWKIRDEIRAMATFRQLNLMQPFTGLGPFDIIFCRNVAIYFSLEDRKRLFNKIANILAPGGYLLLGSTESLTGVCSRFVPKRHLNAIYYQLG